MIMGNHSKKEWLQWQLTETQQLLEVSKDSLLMKVSLENRKTTKGIRRTFCRSKD